MHMARIGQRVARRLLHAQMQESGVPRLPEDLRTMVSYAQALGDALPLLQAELQPVAACIGQASHLWLYSMEMRMRGCVLPCMHAQLVRRRWYEVQICISSFLSQGTVQAA